MWLKKELGYSIYLENVLFYMFARLSLTWNDYQICRLWNARVYICISIVFSEHRTKPSNLVDQH